MISALQCFKAVAHIVNECQADMMDTGQPLPTTATTMMATPPYYY